LYGKEKSITLDKVLTSIKTKELQRLQDAKAEDSGEGLNVSRGRTEKKGGKGKKSRSKSRENRKTKYKCFICHKQGYFKKDCPEKGKGNKGSY
jgi:hypothetical protein